MARDSDPRERPIAVFDSGVGGLTVLHELLVQLPGEDYVYLGDTARFPYGSRSADELADFSMEIAEELLARLAGGMAAPMRNFAGLLQAVPQKMAYALQALIDQGGAAGAPAPVAEAADEPTDGPIDAAEEAPAAAEADTPEPAAEADTDTTTNDNDDTPAAEAGDADEATPAEAADEQE